MRMFSVWSFVFNLLFTYTVVSADVINGTRLNCSCGFYDTGTKELFTDSIVVYFNESDGLPDDFVAENYEHKYEKDWNSVYRQGGHPSNVLLNSSQSLELIVSQATADHLVNGGGIRTARRDIQYGSFRAMMQAPKMGAGGSSVSMKWQYNETEACELSVMNTDSSYEAWVGTFINNEFASRELGVNFSAALNSTAGNRNYSVLPGTLGNGTINPWDYTEYRIDWTKESINFYIGGNLTRSESRREIKALPSVPAPFYIKHWSTGNQFSMEGPPQNQSGANVGWVRLFFNASSMGKDEREVFSSRCSIYEACSVEDISLRGSTRHSRIATRKWKQNKRKEIKRNPALWISVICVAFSSILILHAIIRRTPWRNRHPRDFETTHEQATSSENEGSLSDASLGQVTTDCDNYQSPNSERGSCNSQNIPTIFVEKQHSPSNESPWHGSDDDITTIKTEDGIANSVYGGSSRHNGSRPRSFLRSDSQATTLRVLSPYSSNFNTTSEDMLDDKDKLQRTSKTSSQRSFPVSQVPTIIENPVPVTAHIDIQHAATETTPRPTRERIDYLAGLVALCAILVTVMHFGLTFVPAMVIPGAPVHYKSEYWAQKIIAPFMLNQMWLGIFFTTSTRFLVSSYIKSGNLKDIAKGTVRRCPRLMIPVTAVAIFEYFLIDCGVTSYLRYIPSLTWSTWPYVTRFPTIGHFISEILELIYLVPNAIPQITYNYCTGVLWTLAVQLQGSWLVLTGVIVIYEIKTAWKRFAYYTFCIASHWYAESWGSYLWFGLLLTDLDLTYRYKPWLYNHRTVYYNLMAFCWICVALGFTANILPNWTNFNIIVYEHNIHPDPSSGLPVWKTPNAGYPAYYVPRFNGLLFAAGMQAIVELSTTVQSILSMRIFLFLFPHIFSLYLLHGLVFWSWGAWLLIVLTERDFTYGVSVTAVGLTSYAIIFMILPIVTPIIESLGKDITALVWMNATERSPPKRRTLFPFPKDLFSNHQRKNDVEAAAGLKVGESSASAKEK